MKTACAGFLNPSKIALQWSVLAWWKLCFFIERKKLLILHSLCNMYLFTHRNLLWTALMLTNFKKKGSFYCLFLAYRETGTLIILRKCVQSMGHYTLFTQRLDVGVSCMVRSCWHHAVSFIWNNDFQAQDGTGLKDLIGNLFNSEEHFLKDFPVLLLLVVRLPRTKKWWEAEGEMRGESMTERKWEILESWGWIVIGIPKTFIL